MQNTISSVDSNSSVDSKKFKNLLAGMLFIAAAASAVGAIYTSTHKAYVGNLSAPPRNMPTAKHPMPSHHL